MSDCKFCTWRASHQCGLYNASAGLICWRELVDRGHIRWDCSVWGCPCSRSWLLILAPLWTCPPLWGSPKSYQCFLDEGEEHYICLGPVSLPLLGDGLFHLALADHKKKREGQSLFEASSKECCGALVLFRRVTASSAQVLCFILKNQHVVIAVFAYRLFLFRWDRCLLYQVNRKYHGRFLILPLIVCFWFFFILFLLLFWVTAWWYFCTLIDEKSATSLGFYSEWRCAMFAQLCVSSDWRAAAVITEKSHLAKSTESLIVSRPFLQTRALSCSSRTETCTFRLDH